MIIAARTHRFASRSRAAGVALWAAVVLPLVCGSAAFGDGGLLATSGVIGLATSLGPMSDADIDAVDARIRGDVIASQAAALEMQQVIPQPVIAPRPARLGLPAPAVEDRPSAGAPVSFLPPRPRTAEEMRAASSESRGLSVPPASVPPVRPSVKAPGRIDGPRPEATRPVTGDRPPMPFSRLLSQVRY